MKNAFNAAKISAIITGIIAGLGAYFSMVVFVGNWLCKAFGGWGALMAVGWVIFACTFVISLTFRTNESD